MDKNLIPKIYKISWVDSYGCTTDWEQIDVAKEKNFCLVYSVGFLIHEDDDKLIISPHYAYCHNQVCGDMVIPKCSVKDKQILN